MPLQVDPSYDALTPLIRFETSTVFEMLTSLECVVDPFHHAEWGDVVRTELGSRFVEELEALYRGFGNCSLVTEIGIDAHDPNDVAGFLDQLESMELKRYVFYVLGRLVPLEGLPSTINRTSVGAALARLSDEDDVSHKYTGMPLEWADDPEAHRRRLVALWRTYWDKLFRFHIEDHVACALASIRERQEFVTLRGGTALYEEITGWSELPAMLPANQPYRELRFIPIFRIPRKRVVYYGYGTATILYDCTRSEQFERDIEEAKRQALETMRALADETRLSMLRMIAQHPESNGRSLAKWINLSPSVVSRHLKQLKDAGLIEEHSPDNRNITYSLVYDRINAIADGVIRYIKD